jgi:hypothetical protein
VRFAEASLSDEGEFDWSCIVSCFLLFFFVTLFLLLIFLQVVCSPSRNWWGASARRDFDRISSDSNAWEVSRKGLENVKHGRSGNNFQ